MLRNHSVKPFFIAFIKWPNFLRQMLNLLLRGLHWFT